MDRPAMSTTTTQRMERLLRSLVGVADVRMLWRAHTLRSVHILRDRSTQQHQLIRNIVSGLQAGFGVQLLPTQIHVHDEATVFEAVDLIGEVLAAADTADPDVPGETAAAGSPGNGGRGNGNGGREAGTAHGVGSSVNGRKPIAGHGPATVSNGAAKHVPANGAARRDTNGTAARGRPALTQRDEHEAGTVVIRPSSAPAEIVAAAAELVARGRSDAVTEGLTLERIDVERRAGTLRCRTVLALGDRQYSAIAEVPDSPSAEAELAARVAVDALRAGGLTTAMLDGVGFITIAKTNYCVATVREPGNTTPRAGAAPLIDSMAASATAAVLTALGSFTDARARSRARAGQ